MTTPTQDELREKILFDSEVSITPVDIKSVRMKHLVKLPIDDLMQVIEAYKDNACEEAFKRGYIAGSIDQINKNEEK